MICSYEVQTLNVLKVIRDKVDVLIIGRANVKNGANVPQPDANHLSPSLCAAIWAARVVYVGMEQAAQVVGMEAGDGPHHVALDVQRIKPAITHKQTCIDDVDVALADTAREPRILARDYAVFH